MAQPPYRPDRGAGGIPISLGPKSLPDSTTGTRAGRNDSPSSAQPPWTTRAQECLVSTIMWQFPSVEVADVRPGDHAMASRVDGWLRDYASTRDPKQIGRASCRE